MWQWVSTNRISFTSEHSLSQKTSDFIKATTEYSKKALQYRIITIKDTEEILMADGTTVMVAFDYIKRQPIEIPAEWREEIKKFEQLKSNLKIWKCGNLKMKKLTPASFSNFQINKFSNCHDHFKQKKHILLKMK